MAKMVGFSKPVKTEWLEKVMQLVREGKTEEEAKAELNEYLSYELSSPTVLRKTREILLNIWLRCPEEIRTLALEATKEASAEDRLAVHWTLIMLAYPLVWDSASLMGKVLNLQDTFTTTWLKSKLSEEWGERDTMIESVPRITQTMELMGLLEKVKTGEFKPLHHKVKDEKCVECISTILIRLGDKGYYAVEDVANIPAMFTFDFQLTHEIVYNSAVLNTSNMGGRAVLMAE